MSWEIQLSEAFDHWFRELSDPAQEAIIAAVERLKELDHDLDSAPFVGRMKGAQRRPLRELDASGTGLVVAFTFDPKTCEIVLLAGREAS